MITINKLEHALATAASDIVKAAKFVQHQVLPTLQKVKADEGTVEAITGLVSPQAVNIERVAFAVLGLAIKVMNDAGTAADANGLNLTLDAQLVADLKSIAPAVQTAAAMSAVAGK